MTFAEKFARVALPVNVDVDIFAKFFHIFFTLTVGRAMRDHPSDSFRFVVQFRFQKRFTDNFSYFSEMFNFIWSSRRCLFWYDPSVEKWNVRVHSVSHGPTEKICHLTRVVVTFQTRWRLLGKKNEALIGVASIWKFRHFEFIGSYFLIVKDDDDGVITFNRTFGPTGDDLAAIDGATLVNKDFVTFSEYLNFLFLNNHIVLDVERWEHRAKNYFLNPR